MSSYVIRQNYSESTNQEDMKRFILDKKIITCPWGGWGQDRENVINGIFNENTSGGVTRKSSGQDRMFVESIKIGDIVVIPFSKKKECILAKIVSDVEYAIDTGLFWSNRDGKFNIDHQGDTPFRPVGRFIEILDENFIPGSRLSIRTLSEIKNKNLLNILF